MDDEKRAVKLEEPDEGTIIVSGTDRRYRVAIGGLRAFATELELLTSYEGGPTTLLRGRCRLERRDSISIIGYDEARANELDLIIRGADIAEFEDTFLTKKDEPITAMIGYLEKSWEFSSKSGFFLELRVSRRVVEHLSQCIREGLFEELNIRVKSNELYVEPSDEYAFPAMSVAFYLRPSRASGRVDDPELANGRLARLEVSQKKLLALSERTEAQKTEVSELEPDGVPVLHAVSKIDANANDALRSIARSMEVLPWAIGAAAVLILLFS
jgi:hypothetical protein